MLVENERKIMLHNDILTIRDQAAKNKLHAAKSGENLDDAELRLSILKSLVGDLTAAAKDAHVETLDDKQAESVVKKSISRYDSEAESILKKVSEEKDKGVSLSEESVQAAETAAEEVRAKGKVLSSYGFIEEVLGENETRELVKSIIDSQDNPNMGSVMGELKKHNVNMRVASSIVKDSL